MILSEVIEFGIIIFLNGGNGRGWKVGAAHGEESGVHYLLRPTR
jgi:hypothetical protein